MNIFKETKSKKKKCNSYQQVTNSKTKYFFKKVSVLISSNSVRQTNTVNSHNSYHREGEEKVKLNENVSTSEDTYLWGSL